jgi:hypothetical protein
MNNDFDDPTHRFKEKNFIRLANGSRYLLA